MELMELEDKYLRGYMATSNGYDEFLWLFLGEGLIVCFEQEGEDGYRCADWYFNGDPGPIPGRTSDYKAIGERINSVNEDNTVTYTRKIIIKTNTKVIELTTDGTDSYYPDSIWEVI